MACGYEKMKKPSIEVQGKKWKKRGMDSGKHRILELSVDGEKIEFPIENVDIPEHHRSVDFDIVYLWGKIIVGSTEDDGKIVKMEYNTTRDEWETGTENPENQLIGIKEIADQIIYKK